MVNNPINEDDFDRIFRQPRDPASLERAEEAARDTCCGQCGGQCHAEEFEIPDRFRKEEGQ